MASSRVAVLAGALMTWALVPLAGASEPANASEPATGDPGDPIQLNSGFTNPDDDVWRMEVSPDGKYVVYLTVDLTRDKDALFSVPSAGGEPVLLASGSTVGDSVGRIKITPDSSRVVYGRHSATTGTLDLYSVPIGGGTPIKISGPLELGTWVEWDFTISPDSQTVVYRVDLTTMREMAMFSVPVTGGPVTRLYPPEPHLDYLYGEQVSPDSAWTVVLAIDGDVISIPTGGGLPVELGTGVPFGESFEISPDSRRVLFRSDQGEDIYSLVSAPIAGGPNVALSGNVSESAISPDSQRAVWTEEGNLLSSPIAGGAVETLGEAELFALTPDSRSVVFVGGDGAGGRDLFRVPIVGGVPVALDAPVPHGEQVYPLTVTADSKFAVFGVGWKAVYSVQLDGEGSHMLSRPLDWFGEIDEFRVSADSSRVAYLADQTTNNSHELFSVAINGGSVIRLNAPLPKFGSVTSRSEDRYVITADSRRVIYIADQDIDEVYELYSVLIGWECDGKFASIVGTNGADTVTGTDGDDVIVTFGRKDTIEAGGGDDTICAGKGFDVIDGGRGSDRIFGGGGNDTIEGGRGSDYIDGGRGADFIDAGWGRDTVLGGRGEDTIRGSRGDDLLRGQADDDTLKGGRHNDTCYGGSGTDTAKSCETTVGVP